MNNGTIHYCILEALLWDGRGEPPEPPKVVHAPFSSTIHDFPDLAARQADEFNDYQSVKRQYDRIVAARRARPTSPGSGVVDESTANRPSGW